MTKWVSTDYDGCSYITPGKRYEVIEDSGQGGTIVDDSGHEIYINFKNSGHIDGTAWTVHELTIKSRKYYRTRDGRKVGPMRVFLETKFDIDATQDNHDDDMTDTWWEPDGNRGCGVEHDNLDLIAEWVEETGTLAELNVKPGDVVEDTDDGMKLTVCKISGSLVCGKSEYAGKIEDSIWGLDGISTWRIISRASDTPKTWGDMTDEEKGALLLAKHEGKDIEYHSTSMNVWYKCSDCIFDDNGCGSFERNFAYRIKPQPVTETVTVVGGVKYGFFDGADGTHRMTFTTKDGEPATGTFSNEAGDVITMERA